MENFYPKVTVVTVVINAQDVIEKTINSVINQDYPNLEYVVIDGESQDDTKSIIEKYREKIHKYISEPDNGIYDAMNKASKLASGEWIIYMNAGDIFYSSNSLSKLTKAFNSDADVIFAGVAEILVDDFQTRIFHKMPASIEDIWYQMPTSHQATIVRLSTQRHYQFNTNYRWCADHDMLARIYRDGKKFLTENILFSTFDCGSIGSHRKPQLYIRERWQLSKGLVPFPLRLFRYGKELFHSTVWGNIVTLIKKFLPKHTILYLRKVRGTAGN